LWAWTLDYPHFDAVGDPEVSHTCSNVCDKVAPGATPAGIYCPRHDMRIGALVGKVGNNEIFYIGDRIIYRVPSNIDQLQTLYVRMNDCDNGIGDNDGSIQADIHVSR